MVRARIASCADFHRFEAKRAHLIKHFIERELGINGIEHSNRDFLLCSRRRLRRARCGVGLRGEFAHCPRQFGRTGYGCSQKTRASSSEELSAVKTCGRIRPLRTSCAHSRASRLNGKKVEQEDRKIIRTRTRQVE